MTKAKRRLRNISVEEISLVDSPANKRPFLLFKRGDGSFPEGWKEVEEWENMSDEEINKKFDALSPEEQLDLLTQLQKVDLLAEVGLIQSALERVRQEEGEAQVEKILNSSPGEFDFVLDEQGNPQIVPNPNAEMHRFKPTRYMEKASHPDHLFDVETNRWVRKSLIQR